jgi:hypothetical protein
MDGHSSNWPITTRVIVSETAPRPTELCRTLSTHRCTHGESLSHICTAEDILCLPGTVVSYLQLDCYYRGWLHETLVRDLGEEYMFSSLLHLCF